MNKRERFDYYNAGKLQPIVQICLLDWLAYWTTNGIDTIEDPLLRTQTAAVIDMLLTDLNGITAKVAELAMGEEQIKTAAEPSESDINTAVVAIMATRLRWLTGIDSIAE